MVELGYINNATSQEEFIALIRNLILIAFSNIISCQVESNRTIIVSGLMSGLISNVTHNKFENHKNSTFKHFILSRVWRVRHMSDFRCYII